MTAPLDLAALRALLERATPGPWLTSDDTTPSGSHEVCTAYITAGRSGYTYVYASRDFERDAQADQEANLALILATRNALPALLDRLERAEKVVQAAQSFVHTAIQTPYDGGATLSAAADLGEVVADWDATIDAARGGAA